MSITLCYTSRKGWHIKAYDLVVLGAGASALMLVSQLCKKGFKNIAVIDHNPKIGMKIKISGGGKCNVTNEDVTQDNYLGSSEFVTSVLQRYTPTHLLKYLQERNVVPKIRSLGQYFCSKDADEVIGALKKDTQGVSFLLSHKILEVSREDDGSYSVHTDREKISAKHLVIV